MLFMNRLLSVGSRLDKTKGIVLSLISLTHQTSFLAFPSDENSCRSGGCFTTGTDVAITWYRCNDALCPLRPRQWRTLPAGVTGHCSQSANPIHRWNLKVSYVTRRAILNSHGPKLSANWIALALLFVTCRPIQYRTAIAFPLNRSWHRIAT